MARQKKLRKSEFTELPNCFGEEVKEKKGNWAQTFAKAQPMVLELGCGTAQLSYALAKRHPERNYMGVDLKPVRLWIPAKKALDEKQDNILFLHIHLLKIEEYFGEGEVEEIWITFPDPFPKLRHAKHRMITPPFLKQYQKILRKGGKVHFKTDNLELFHFALEVFVKEGNIRIQALSFDLHENEEISEEIKIETDYEKKFRAEGIKINYVCWEFLS